MRAQHVRVRALKRLRHAPAVGDGDAHVAERGGEVACEQVRVKVRGDDASKSSLSSMVTSLVFQSPVTALGSTMETGRTMS